MGTGRPDGFRTFGSFNALRTADPRSDCFFRQNPHFPVTIGRFSLSSRASKTNGSIPLKSGKVEI